MKKNLNNLKKEWLVLLIIIIFGLILRIVDINNNPKALYGDELTMVYDSYSLLKTGHDQLGDFLPLTFKMGAGRPAGYVYASIPFVALFGPSALGVRFLSILSGLGIIFLTYFLGKRWFGSGVGLAAAGLMAISPWDINLSRGGFEAHFALFLTLLGIWAFMSAKVKPRYLIIASLSFILAINTYPTYKMTIPLLLLLLLWFTGIHKFVFQKGWKIFTVISMLILLVGSSISVFQTLTAGSDNRFSEINVFGQQDLKEKIIQKINYEREISNLSQSIKPLFHNKSLEYGFIIGESYLKNFSPDFLFLHGDRNPRHNMSTMGEFYIIEALFIVFGLIYLGRRNKKSLIFLLVWILISPLPIALLLEPHALRNSLMIPPMVLLSGAGLFYLLELSMRKKIIWLLGIVIIGIILNFIFFVERLYFLAPNQFGNFWSAAAKDASLFIIQNKDSFNYIIMSDRIDNAEYAYPTYAKINPNIVIEQNHQRSLLGGLLFKKIGSVYIGHIPDNLVETFLAGINKPVLYIGSPEEKTSLRDYQTVNNKDGTIEFIFKKVTK